MNIYNVKYWLQMKCLMNKKYKSKKGLVYLNQYHVIFCPKYRRKVLVGDIEKD